MSIVSEAKGRESDGGSGGPENAVEAKTDQRRPFLGIALVAGSTLIFAASDAATQAVVGSIPAVEIVWFRYLAYLAVAMILLTRSPPVAVLASRRKGLQVLRGLAALGSAGFFVAGLNWIPVGEATSISFTAPLIVVVLSALLLGETVRARDWAAAAAGFAGVLLIIQPGSASFQPAAVFPLLSACCWSCALIVTRRMSGTEPARTTIFYTAATGFVLTSAVLPLHWITPTPGQWLALCGIGISTASAHMMIVVAYAHARASLLAPLSYIQVIWAVMMGVALFGHVPSAVTLFGAALIAGSGLFIALSERRPSRDAAPAPRGTDAT
jgi:drug/metabolite transporter (DMT)-like permease